MNNKIKIHKSEIPFINIGMISSVNELINDTPDKVLQIYPAYKYESAIKNGLELEFVFIDTLENEKMKMKKRFKIEFNFIPNNK